MSILQSTFDKHKKLMLEAAEVGVIEKNKQENEKALQSARSSGIKLVPITINPITNKPVYIYDNAGRYTVIVDMGGFTLPFYVSRGDGGKKSVPVDKWYPFFGIGSDGWMNKGGEKMIMDFYSSAKLKSVADKLNSTLGKPVRDPENVFGWSGATDKYGDKTKEFESKVNNGLSPVAHKGSNQDFLGNINSVLRKLGDTKQYGTTSEKSSIKGKLTLTHDGKNVVEANISANIGRAIVQKHGDDAKYFSSEQFQIQKQKDDTWKLIHNKAATNITTIDGKEVTEPTTLVKGMKIALGKTGKFPMEVG
jgi:hypothetical protein